MNLALCCISKTLSDNGHNFRSMTYTQFTKAPFDQAIRELSQRILHNFKMTHQTIKFCQNNNIQGYRVSSSLAPILTHKDLRLSISDLPNFSSIKETCDGIKKTLLEKPIRLSSHPSEYITLSSDKKECIDNSIADLKQHSEIFSLLDLPEDYRSPLNIHVRQEGDPQTIADKVLSVYDELPDNIRKRLVLENNDNAKGIWGIKNLIKYFHKTRSIPITYDSLHHSILTDSLTPEEAFNAAYETWPTVPLFHYSEGIDGTRKHADMPTATPEDYGKEVFYDIELKNKCQAIFKIRDLTKEKSIV